MRFVVFLYRGLIGPALHGLAGPGFGCRFVPSCSEYFVESLEVHGVLRGFFIGVSRVFRCHPFAKAGYDPVVASSQARHSRGRCATRV